MSEAVATWADTSSNQAIKDPGEPRCGYSNLGKIISVPFVAAPDFAGNPRFPTSSERAKSGLCKAVPLSATVDAFIIIPLP
jgi:hypothetical protein